MILTQPAAFSVRSWSQVLHPHLGSILKRVTLTLWHPQPFVERDLPARTRFPRASAPCRTTILVDSIGGLRIGKAGPSRFIAKRRSPSAWHPLPPANTVCDTAKRRSRETLGRAARFQVGQRIPNPTPLRSGAYPAGCLSSLNPHRCSNPHRYLMSIYDDSEHL
jgi:hypothetical protein